MTDAQIMARAADRVAWDAQEQPTDCALYRRRREQSLALAYRQLRALSSRGYTVNGPQSEE